MLVCVCVWFLVRLSSRSCWDVNKIQFHKPKILFTCYLVQKNSHVQLISLTGMDYRCFLCEPNIQFTHKHTHTLLSVRRGSPPLVQPRLKEPTGDRPDQQITEESISQYSWNAKTQDASTHQQEVWLVVAHLEGTLELKHSWAFGRSSFCFLFSDFISSPSLKTGAAHLKSQSKTTSGYRWAPFQPSCSNLLHTVSPEIRLPVVCKCICSDCVVFVFCYNQMNIVFFFIIDFGL